MKKIYNILTLMLLTLSEIHAQETHDRRPNFIIIYSDDQRQDALGENGNRYIRLGIPISSIFTEWKNGIDL